MVGYGLSLDLLTCVDLVDKSRSDDVEPKETGEEPGLPKLDKRWLGFDIPIFKAIAIKLKYVGHNGLYSH